MCIRDRSAAACRGGHCFTHAPAAPNCWCLHGCVRAAAQAAQSARHRAAVETPTPACAARAVSTSAPAATALADTAADAAGKEACSYTQPQTCGQMQRRRHWLVESGASAISGLEGLDSSEKRNLREAQDLCPSQSETALCSKTAVLRNALYECCDACMLTFHGRVALTSF